MPPRAAAKPTPRRGPPAVHGPVVFFLAIILFLLFSLGSVVVAQKVALTYMVREFPRVAERNYRVLQDDLQALEGRLSRQMEIIGNVCASPRGGWVVPPNPDAASLPRITP